MLDVSDVAGPMSNVLLYSDALALLTWLTAFLPSSRTLTYIFVPLLLFLCAASGLVRIIVRQQISPLRRLRGPPSPSFFMGNLAAMHDQENNNLIATWEADHGPAFIYHGLFGGARLMITDPRAVAHVLGNAYDYPKPDFVRDSLASMAAGHDGLLTSEGEQHKRQRKIISPAFSAGSIRAVLPIFWEKAGELRDIWLRIIDDDDEGVDLSTRLNLTAEQGGTRIDALAWLGRATLDVIGLAGFGYTFNSLTDEYNELALAFAAVFTTARKFRVMTILQAWFPILRIFREENETEARTRTKIRDIGLGLIAERKEAILAESALTGSKEDPKDLGNDLLSVLIRSNLATMPSQQMSTQEILCQISTFMAAGHETTASALVWILYALSQHRDIQKLLRMSLQELSPSSVTLDDNLQRHEYLDWVVREALRLYAPVSSTMRVCDSPSGWDEIPLSGSVTDRYGRESRTVRIRRGDIVSIPLAAVNRRKEVWGEDAMEFKPERWGNLPSSTNTIPGLWSNILTFLNGNPVNGNRSCIGYKFAIAEIKVFLYVLLRDLDFSIDPALVIERKVNVVTRPCVKSEPEKGNQMPLLVRRVQDASPLPSAVLSNPTGFGESAPRRRR
ncbi:cytochrome P450 [Fomitiporia mediterranea MF3/22]|uniref:cytochrome P450 n=1 Tax=Fomitiporia mediterranea (strain MF3/22) TaxID=694068 RepID=UPI0004407F34|nr:cytochrome P450 [Fomitiporia mediterranea MF3/22]EJC98034.1 cytochrome P450 [Fomitiporia mediterranea MF3/22]